MIAAAGGAARAQDQVRTFDAPILVLNTGGHHAPIRDLAFTPDERRLLSAGEDKIVRVWDLSADPPGLERTIRPPIFRGSAGSIFALALSPPDAQGQHRLAVAGFGVQSSRGDIGLFRVPGAADRPQGDVDRWIAGGDGARGAEATGHTQVVASLAFARDGNVLASAGSDGTVRLWGPAGEALGVLSAPGLHAVNRLVFAPDGKLLTGSRDGVVRVWDIAARRIATQAPPVGANPADPAGASVNALAVSPDGRWAVVGCEDGRLLRFDLAAPDLAASAARLPTGPQQASIEAIAFAPDGRLAVSLLSHRLARSFDRPDPSCDVEIRRMPDGAVMESPFSATNRPPNPIADRVLALAFSPKGRYLAIGGGPDQAILLADLLAPRRAWTSLVGQGSGVRDVGFVDPAPGAGDLPDVAYSHAPPVPARPATYWGFSLKDRTPTSFPADRVRGALESFGAWSVRPVSPQSLEVLEGGRKAFDVALSAMDGRWWAYSFLPPGPGHDRPALAVACKYGVAIYRLEGGTRTRFLDGHGGSVLCLAPSRDGKWLATGSDDQTVRLWGLAGCDAPAMLGADFERRDGSLVVKAIAPRGFAEASGLEVGDVIEAFLIAAKRLSADEFLAAYAASPPNQRIEFAVRRKGAKPGDTDRTLNVGTSKRDAPRLSLFVGRDREWVLWRPRGDYDSSVTGDSTYLGWHVNRATIANPAPSDYFPLRTYERALRHPRNEANSVLDRLLASADDRIADGPDARPVDVSIDRPPVVTPVVAPGAGPIRDRAGVALAAGSPLPDRIVIDQGSSLAVDWKVTPWQGRAPGAFEVRFDGESLRAPEVPAFDPAVGASTVPSRIDLGPGFHRVQASAKNDSGTARERVVEVEVIARPVPAAVPAAPPRLTVLAIAPEFSDPLIPGIPSAATDAEDLSRFFDRHLVVDGAGAPFPPIDPRGRVFLGRAATADRVVEAVNAAASGPAQRGDVVVVVIESHVLNYGRETKIVAADSRGFPPKDMIPAESVATALGTLARRGCRVVVLIDGIHTAPGQGWDADLNEWARTLRHDAMATTFLASSRRPSTVYGDRRVMTRAVLDSVSARGRSGVLTLSEFRKAVLDAVSRLSSRRQEAACFVPDGIDDRLPLLNTRAAAR